MMAYKILMLVLIFSSYFYFSYSTCLVYMNILNIVLCEGVYVDKISNISQLHTFNSNKETIRRLFIKDSKILEISDNAFNALKHLEYISIFNTSLHKIEKNVFVNFNYLDTLKLTYNDLTEIDFNLPPSVTNLNVSHNKISHIKDSHNYQKLNYLDLSYNSIIYIDITWADNQKLIFLSLSHNNLEYIPETMKSIIIENFDLSHNNISMFNCAQVTNKIDLSHNNFRELCNFSSSIRNIDFHNNFITHIHGYNFKNLTKLSYLNLSSNHIKTIYPDSFHDLIALGQIDLSKNDISEIPIGVFYHLNNLYWLSLSNNNINKLDHGVFTGLESLDVLLINDNKLDNIDAIYTLRFLRKLFINNNNLYDLEVDQINSHLRSLFEIKFNIKDISCEELMIYLLELSNKHVLIHEGNSKNAENINGIQCYSASKLKINRLESDEQKMVYISNYLAGISAAFIVILVVLIFVIIFTLFTLYQVYIKHRKQTVIDGNISA